VRIVLALGGNALLRRGEDPGGAPVRQDHLAQAAETTAAIAREREVVLTHGNGPQVGLLALQAEAHDPDHPVPLDLLGAESGGLIGYLLARELGNRLPGRSVVTVLTQVRVDGDDPAFHAPKKPVGPVYTESEARHRAREKGWSVGPDGSGWRRLVPSPTPRAVVEADAIRTLVEGGCLVICGGGGGIPVTDGSHGLVGAEAVVDKDATAVLLARAVDAEGLVLLTDVDGVFRDFDTDRPRLVSRMTASEARAFPGEPGSMGPKIRACADFVEGGGSFAAIGSLEAGLEVVRGDAGTRIVPDGGREEGEDGAARR
jgi:carbamate kinase